MYDSPSKFIRSNTETGVLGQMLWLRPQSNSSKVNFGRCGDDNFPTTLGVLLENCHLPVSVLSETSRRDEPRSQMRGAATRDSGEGGVLLKLRRLSDLPK